MSDIKYGCGANTESWEKDGKPLLSAVEVVDLAIHIVSDMEAKFPEGSQADIYSTMKWVLSQAETQAYALIYNKTKDDNSACRKFGEVIE
jgi:phosphotransferase system HPr-like phosphotransfer protein